MNIDLNGKTYNVIFLKKTRIKGKAVKEFEVCVLQDDQSLWRIGIFAGKDEKSALNNALGGEVQE